MDSDKPSYKGPPREVSYYAYKRINHFNEWLAQFQAKECTDIPQEIYDQILLELKKERITQLEGLKPAKIREILKKIKANKYYEHVPHITHRLNGKNAPDFFTRPGDMHAIFAPLAAIGHEPSAYDISVKVNGGGVSGQTSSVVLGLARALVKINSEWTSAMRKAGLLTRDARIKERKKPGLKKARKAPTYTKR